MRARTVFAACASSFCVCSLCASNCCVQIAAGTPHAGPAGAQLAAPSLTPQAGSAGAQLAAPSLTLQAGLAGAQLAAASPAEPQCDANLAADILKPKGDPIWAPQQTATV